MSAITIRVTADDIVNGSCKGRHCPIALALKRQTTLHDFTIKHPGIIEFDSDGSEYRLPPIARRFLRKFDLGRVVKPFEFELHEALKVEARR